MAYTLTNRQIVTGGIITANPASLIDRLCIGDVLEFELTYTGSGGDNFTDKQIWFNPALFLPTAIATFDPTINLKGFLFDTTGQSTGAIYPMSLALGGNESINDDFLSATLNYVSATSIIIDVQALLIADKHQFISSTVWNNEDKFKKNSHNNVTNFDNNEASIYNEDKALHAWLNVGDPSAAAGSDECECLTKIQPIITSAASLDGDPLTGATMAHTPVDPGAVTDANGVMVVNFSGRSFPVGNGVKTKAFYVSGDGGTTARGWSSTNPNGQIQAGDTIHINPSVYGLSVAGGEEWYLIYEIEKP